MILIKSFDDIWLSKGLKGFLRSFIESQTLDLDSILRGDVNKKKILVCDFLLIILKIVATFMVWVRFFRD